MKNNSLIPVLLYASSGTGTAQAELDAAQANGLAATDLSAIGSGVQNLNGNHYLSVTDAWTQRGSLG